MSTPTIITDSATLAERCAVWREADFLTVDTEFMREDTFWAKLCLVQVGAPDGETVAIDPLVEGIDLTPFYDLLVRSPVLKVFHAARQDVEVLLPLAGGIPQPLFDTQIAAMVCGFGDAVGYETLVTKLAGATIDKTLRFSDWSRRPLTERQLLYALSDVSHLRIAYEKLEEQLVETGRRAWLDEEFAILMDPAIYEAAPEEAWRRIKVRGGNRRFFAVLRELAAWRETEAKRRNAPRNWVLRDQALSEVAAQRPASSKELAKLRSISQRVAEGPIGDAVIKAVKRGLELPDHECPTAPPRREKPMGVGPLIDLLKVLLKLRSEQSGVAQRLIANAEDLERIASGDDDDVPAMRGWRRELFGAYALDLKAGRLALSVERGQIKLLSRAADGTLSPTQTRRSTKRRTSRRPRVERSGVTEQL
jgi:ribonuclease D